MGENKLFEIEMFEAKNAKEYYLSSPDFPDSKRRVLYDLKEFENKMKIVKEKLKQENIKYIKVPFKGIGNFIDDAHYYAEKKAGEENDFIISMEHQLFFAIRTTGQITLTHEISSTKKIKRTEEIFIEVFGKKRYLTKKLTQDSPITIQLEKISKIITDPDWKTYRVKHNIPFESSEN